MRVCIDPGHGGNDPGGGSLGRLEKNLVLQVQPLLWKLLAELGHFCFTTRVKDEFVEIGDRAKYSNALEADVFVSLHCNASDSRASRGPWTLHAAVSTRGRELAVAIQRNLAKATGGNPASVYPDKSGWTSDRRLGVLWGTRAPAVLVELGFMTNPEEIRDLEDTLYQERLAGAIALGVDQWSRG